MQCLEGQKRKLDPQELEIQVGYRNSQVGAGN